MIIGIGNDIVENKRIEVLLEKYGENFINKFMTPEEKKFYKNRFLLSASVAKVFAAKEAVIKALDVNSKEYFKNIEICHKETGAPFIQIKKHLEDKLVENIKEKTGRKKIQRNQIKIFITLSDENSYSFALCLIEYIC